jgi:two-component system sensor histidine kinase MtrB
MRPQLSPLSQSLAAKVILSTVLLSLVVVWLTGSALYSQLSDGIKKVSLESSLADARSVFFSTQYQLLLVDGKSNSEIKNSVDEIISTSINTGTTEGARELILLKVFTKSELSKIGLRPNYSFASNGLLSSTVPQDLREEIATSESLAHRFAPLTYRAGITIDALYVGQRITIPASGEYEMFLVFTLVNQGATLDLVQNSLFLTGVVLLLLIGLITYLVVRQVVRPVRDAARVASHFTEGDFTQRLKIKSNCSLSLTAG